MPTTGRSVGQPTARKCSGVLVGGENADTPAFRQDALHERDLQQAGGRDRHRTVRDELRVQNGEKAAARGYAVDAKSHQFIGRAQEQVQHAVGVRLDDAVGCGAAHHGELHGKAPGGRIADVAWQALKSRIQHHDADADAVYRLAAMEPGHRASPSAGLDPATCVLQQMVGSSPGMGANGRMCR
jgi:hypothetical protein